MIATMLLPNRRPIIALLLLVLAAVPARAAGGLYQRAEDKLRYQNCLGLAAREPGAALGVASNWIEQRGGAPAEHCAAVALVGLKRYAEAAAKLDALGRAPRIGDLRPELFDQAGNAWLLAGNTDKAVASFQGALALSARDADLYADLARAQAMQADWSAVEADLNAALALQPRRADLLVLRASARQAQNRLAEARADADAAVALSPHSGEALVERGSVRRDMGDFRGARADFSAVLAMGASGSDADAARRNIAALDAAAKTAAPKKK